MAIYHASIKTVGRSAGRSATAAAAYRAGAEIEDERTGQIHDYRRKGGVEFAELVLPAAAPEWAADRAALWNAAEQAETRKNSTVAREFEVALPAELSAAERRRLALDFAREIVAKHGCAADVSIHAPGRAGDNRNHHAHILVTTRRLVGTGFTEKTRELDDQKSGMVQYWRERFAVLQNERLQEAGVDARVDHRSLRVQGVEREPARHLGPSASGFERRTGEASRRRLDFEQNAMARLAQAKEAGELERQALIVERSIVNLGQDIEAAKRERTEALVSQRQEAEGLAQEEWGKVEKMTAAELRAEIVRVRPPSVQDLVANDPGVMAAHAQRQGLVDRLRQAEAAERHAREEAAAWREAHPLRARMHDLGVASTSYLAEREQRAEASRETRAALGPQAAAAAQQAARLQDVMTAQFERETEPARQVVERLKDIQQQKEGLEREARREEYERQEMVKEFRGIAARRGGGGFGYRDDGRHWQALPARLREAVDWYNQQPKAVQEAFTERIKVGRGETATQLRKFLAQRREQERDRGRGFER